MSTFRGNTRGSQRGRGSARGRGGPRLPGTLSTELGIPKPRKQRDEERRDVPRRGRGGVSGASAHSRDIQPPKRKRDASPPVEEPTRAGKNAGRQAIVIEKGSGFRTKAPQNAQTPLARLLAAQAPGSFSSGDKDEDEELIAEPSKIKRRKMANDDGDEVVDISIMGGSFAGSGGGVAGKKTQAEVDEDAEIAWLEWQLNRGKGKGKARSAGDGDEDLGDDGLDGMFFRGRWERGG